MSVQLWQFAILFLLVLITPFYNAYTWKRRARQAQQDADAARLELQRTREALSELERDALDRYRTTPHPMREPHGFQPTLDMIAIKHPTDPYILPLGWQVVDGEPDLATVSLHGESEYFCGHVLLTGESGGGKDGWLFQATASLCRRTTPQEFKLYWIDGKGPDGALWRGKAHNWQPPVTEAEEIPAAIKRLEAERSRRMQLLIEHGVTKWEELPYLVRAELPLLWIVVSELKLLKAALGSELEAWLERELTSARAAGMRYCIATQTATNMKTEWRSQIGLFMAGWQSSRNADMPNIGIGTEEIREKGAIPPSQLDGKGYFTARVKKDAVTLRVGYVPLAERKLILFQLPSLPVRSSTPSTAWESAGSVLPASAEEKQKAAILDLVEDGRMEEMSLEQRFEERRAAVVAAIAEGKTDGQILKEIFNITGGRYYAPLKQKIAGLRPVLQHSTALSA